jgi:hypothetical protein
MALWISEFGGFPSGRKDKIPTEPVIRTQQLSTATAGSTASQVTLTLGAGTNMVALKADSGMFFAFGSSTSSTANGFSSTNSQKIAAGQELFRYCKPYAAVIASST